MAGAAGFEPANGGTKSRCLTAWRRPNGPLGLSRPDRRRHSIDNADRACKSPIAQALGRQAKKTAVSVAERARRLVG